MTWAEFRAWAESAIPGCHLPPTIGGAESGSNSGAAHLARVLGITGWTGSGHHVEYGPAHQRRLDFYARVIRIVGEGQGRGSPRWLRQALQMAGEQGSGWVVVEGPTNRVYHVDLPIIPTQEALQAGVLMVPILEVE